MGEQGGLQSGLKGLQVELGITNLVANFGPN